MSDESAVSNSGKGSEDPLWRRVLCWSAVLTFFTMPLVVFVLHIIAIERNWNINARWTEFTGIAGFYQVISTLVFGLAGLQSFDRFVATRNAKSDKGQQNKS